MPLSQLLDKVAGIFGANGNRDVQPVLPSYSDVRDNDISKTAGHQKKGRMGLAKGLKGQSPSDETDLLPAGGTGRAELEEAPRFSFYGGQPLNVDRVRRRAPVCCERLLRVSSVLVAYKVDQVLHEVRLDHINYCRARAGVQWTISSVDRERGEDPYMAEARHATRAPKGLDHLDAELFQVYVLRRLVDPVLKTKVSDMGGRTWLDKDDP